MSPLFLLVLGLSPAAAEETEATAGATEPTPTTLAAGSTPTDEAASTQETPEAGEEVLLFEVDIGPAGTHCCRQNQCEKPCEEEEEQRTLLGSDVDHGGYGGPTWGIALVDGEGVSTDGGRGGWVIDHRWVLGGYGWSSKPMGEKGAVPGRASGGGVFVERMFFPNSEIHPTFEVAFGGGSLQTCAGKQHTMHAATALRLEVNVARWARVAAGPRIDTQIVPGYPSKILVDGTAIGGDLLLKFGWF